MDMDEDGFKDRVDKVFGSISSSSSWSLTAQLQRTEEWKRHRHSHRDTDDDDQIPFSSSFQTKTKSKSNLHDDDDWGDIRCSIGLDSTLDHEEEEDAYDKMAQGREDYYHSFLCMKNVTTDHGPFHNILPHDATKPSLRQHDTRRIKSILKRKTAKTCTSDDVVPKPAKRVRFDSTCKNAPQTPQVSQQNGPPGGGVPDYILNPSNYTRYTFDDCSSHDGEAYLQKQELDQIKESSKHGGELPKSLVFIPRKKRGEEHVSQQSSTQGCSTIGIAAIVVEAAQQGEEMQQDVDESYVHDDDDDDVSTKASCQKRARQYRSRMGEYDDVS